MGWDAAVRCRPCVLGRVDPFAHRALALWNLVGWGELVDQEKGITNWHVDWAAFREARECGHALFEDEDPAELFEAVMLIKGEMQNPTPADQLDLDG